MGVLILQLLPLHQRDALHRCARIVCCARLPRTRGSIRCVYWRRASRACLRCAQAQNAAFSTRLQRIVAHADNDSGIFRQTRYALKHIMRQLSAARGLMVVVWQARNAAAHSTRRLRFKDKRAIGSCENAAR